jgi:hypothetical protein
VFISVTGLPPLCRVIVCEPLAYVPPTMPILAVCPVSAVSLKIGSIGVNVPPTVTVLVLPLTLISALSAAGGAVAR